MKCLKCGAELVPGVIFCRNCGNRVDGANQTPVDTNQLLNSQQMVNNSVQNTNINQNNMFNQQNVGPGYTKEQTINSNSIYQNVDDELLQISYIGYSYSEFLFGGGKSPLWVFLFGVLYLLYRKMYLLSAIWLAIYYAIVVFVPNITIVIAINFIFNIIMMFLFKKIYMFHVNNQIQKIKLKNPTASKEELVGICIKKGGTSMISSIVFVFLCVFVAVSFVISQMKQITQNQDFVYNYISRIEGQFKIDDDLKGPMIITTPNQIKLDDLVKKPDEVSLRVDYNGKVTFGIITYKGVTYEYSNRTLKAIK